MKIFLKTILLLWVLLIGYELFAVTRLAIVSEQSDKFEDLLTAGLSPIEDIELVERSEIRKILKEQKVAADVINSQQAFALGKLLKTDLFVVIESEQKTKKAIGLVIFDASTGIRYWDSALPNEDIDKVANVARNAVKQALRKREKALEGKLKYISLLSVRNADLPRDKDPFCKAIGILLMRQLGNSANFAVLERSQLDWLNKERHLPGMEWTNELLASSGLLTLEFTHQEGEKENCSLSLTNKQKLNISGNLETPAKFTNAIAAKFAEVEKVNGIANSQVNTKLEANRFYNEGLLLHHHKKYLKACEKLEAAHALAPGNFEYQKNLSFYLADAAMQSIDNSYAGINKNYQFLRKIHVDTPVLLQALKKINESLDHKLDLTDKALKISDLTEQKRKMDQIFGWSRMKLFFQEISQVTGGHTKETRSLLKQCQDKALKCYLIRYRTLKDFAKTKKGYYSYSMWVRASLKEIRFYSDNAHEAFSNIIKIGRDYLEFNKKHGNPDKTKDCISSIFKALNDARLFAPWPVTKKDLKLQDDFFAEFKLSSRPDIQLAAEFNLFLQKIRSTKMPIDEVIKEISTFKKSAMLQISALPPNTPKDQITNCYITASKSDNKLPYKNRLKSNIRLFRFMENRGEFVQHVALEVIRDAAAFSEHQAEGLKLIEDSYVMLKNPKTKILQYNKENFDGNMNRMRRYIYSKNKNLMPKTEQTFPWIESKQLFAVNNKDKIYRICSPVLHGNTIYFAQAGVNKKNQPYVQMVTINLETGKRNFGTSAQLNWATGDYYKVGGDRHFNSPLASSACFGNGTYFLGTIENGIYIFPPTGKVKIINKENGLPSNRVQSLTVFNNKLYAGLGQYEKDSYLICYDLSKNTINLLASSQRKEKTSPFDDTKPTRYSWMMVDPERNRILLFALKGRRNQATGLWSINPANNKMRQLFHANSSCGNAAISENNQLLIHDSFTTFTYNLDNEKTKLLNSFHKIGASADMPFRGSGASSFRDIGPQILLDGWLWSADLFARISPDKKQQQVFNFHTGKSLFKPKEFLQSVKIGNKQYVIAASQQQLWMFKITEKNK